MTFKPRPPSARTASNISDVSTDLVRSDVDSGPLSKALGRHSTDLWGLLCTKGAVRPLDLSFDSSSRGGSSSGEPDFREQYKAMGRIGQGSTSVVYSAIRHVDGRKVALKILRGRSVEDTQTAEEEFKILRRVQHPCIVQLIEMQQVAGHASLVFDFCDGIELVPAVHGEPEKRLREAQACRLTAALVRAVDHIHRHGIVHCDVRPQNIMVSNDMQSLKLLDFGSATILTDGERCKFTMPETGAQVACQAPEVILGEEPTPCADVWQVGLCAYFMLSGSLPQKRDSCKPTRDAIKVVATYHVSFSSAKWATIPRGVKVLLRRCMTIDKLERPTSHDLVRKSAWLRPEMERAAQTEGDRHTGPFPEGVLGGSEPHSMQSLGDTVDITVGQIPKTQDTLLSSTNQSTSYSLSTVSPGTDPMLGDEACSKAVVVGPDDEKATILLVNYGERTYKVRFQDGRIKVVPAKDVRRR